MTVTVFFVIRISLIGVCQPLDVTKSVFSVSNIFISSITEIQNEIQYVIDLIIITKSHMNLPT